jgi:DNA repair protein NreA
MSDQALITKEELFRKIPELKSIDLNLCVSCKGVKLACNLPRCPLFKAFDPPKVDTNKIETISDGNNIFGPVPQIFVGDNNYPNVFSGPMTSLYPDGDHANLSGKPNLWTGLDITGIVEMRFGLLRGMKRTPVRFSTIRNVDERIISGIQELAMSISPVDVESSYYGKIDTNIKLDSIMEPHGPSGAIRKLEVTGHARIPNIVEQTLNDELTANQQIIQISKSGQDVYYLQNVLSAGLTGIGERKKLVPTRWAITATDDIIGRDLTSRLIDYPLIQNILILRGGFFGNYYTHILLPEAYSFEHFECWGIDSIFTLGQQKVSVSQDHEGLKAVERYKGKSGYSNQSGGYYAARISVLNYLHKIRKQARVISIREITNEYIIPAGVWVVREASRVATENNPIEFQSRGELEIFLRSTLRVSLDTIYNKSVLFAQSSIDEFF